MQSVADLELQVNLQAGTARGSRDRQDCHRVKISTETSAQLVT